MVPE
ncbi:hypothetical protein LINGRAHAP2_LOCUS2951 [Linum grandiflorum]|jgi:hypothetical protein